MEKPSPTSVYLYYDQHGVLLYVGITARSIRRQDEHNRTQQWWQFVKRQEVEHFDTRLRARGRESELIRRFRPPFNVQQNPDHEVARLAFMAYHESTSEFTTGLDMMRHHKRVVPLRFEQQEEDNRVLLSTEPAFAPIATKLVLGPEPRAFFGSRHVGSVDRLYTWGPVAFISILHRRGYYEVGEKPFLKVKVSPTKGGVDHFAIVQARLSTESEDTVSMQHWRELSA